MNSKETQEEKKWLKKVKREYKNMTKEERLSALLEDLPFDKREEALRLIVPQLKRIKRILNKGE